MPATARLPIWLLTALLVTTTGCVAFSDLAETPANGGGPTDNNGSSNNGDNNNGTANNGTANNGDNNGTANNGDNNGDNNGQSLCDEACDVLNTCLLEGLGLDPTTEQVSPAIEGLCNTLCNEQRVAAIECVVDAYADNPPATRCLRVLPCVEEELPDPGELVSVCRQSCDHMESCSWYGSGAVFKDEADCKLDCVDAHFLSLGTELPKELYECVGGLSADADLCDAMTALCTGSPLCTGACQKLYECDRIVAVFSLLNCHDDCAAAEEMTPATIYSLPYYDCASTAPSCDAVGDRCAQVDSCAEVCGNLLRGGCQTIPLTNCMFDCVDDGKASDLATCASKSSCSDRQRCVQMLGM